MNVLGNIGLGKISSIFLIYHGEKPVDAVTQSAVETHSECIQPDCISNQEVFLCGTTFHEILTSRCKSIPSILEVRFRMRRIGTRKTCCLHCFASKKYHSYRAIRPEICRINFFHCSHPHLFRIVGTNLKST